MDLDIENSVLKMQYSKLTKTMKKLVFMFVALAAISFASCGNKAEAPATTDSTSVDSTANDSTAKDSAATDSAATPAAATDSVAK